MSREVFTEEFLESLPTDTTEGLLALCDRLLGEMMPHGTDLILTHDDVVEAYAALEAFIDTFDIVSEIPPLVFSENRGEHMSQVHEFVRATQKAVEKRLTDERFFRARSKFCARFGGFIYEFSDGDLSRIQELLNELRDEIVDSDLFDAKHKQRVLDKVESLQRELHKKIASLDKLWGFLGEAGVALGKFGNDAKPFVDRIKEIAQITWRTQARAEGLPSGTTLPLLTSGDAEERDDA